MPFEGHSIRWSIRKPQKCDHASIEKHDACMAYSLLMASPLSAFVVSEFLNTKYVARYKKLSVAFPAAITYRMMPRASSVSL